MGCRGRGRVPFPCINDIEAFLLGQRQYSQLLAVETSDGELGKVNRKPALIHWQQAHPLAPQHLTQHHIVLLPSNLALMMHTARTSMLPGYSGSGTRAGDPRGAGAYSTA